MTTLRIPAEQSWQAEGHDYQARTVSQTVRARWARAQRALPAGEDPDGHVS